MHFFLWNQSIAIIEVIPIPGFRKIHMQYPEKLNVCAGVLNNYINCWVYLFLSNNLTGELYLNLLMNYIDSMILESFRRQFIFSTRRIILYYAVPVRQFLNQYFPDH